MLLLLLTASTYFYYNWRYFHLVGRLQNMARPRVWIMLTAYAVNYLFFVFCSVMEFPLLVNWFLFAFLLFFETLLYNRGDVRGALFSTLIGILFGLAVNIFCRSVFAIVMSRPMQSFDNQTSDIANLKGLPVMIGFLLTGVVMQMMGSSERIKRLRLILNHPRHQTFLLEIMAGLFIYLFLNLLLYSTPLNDIILKIWSIKSCLFSIVGLYIAVRYTQRTCELDDYREKNRRIARNLEKRQREEERLRQEVSVDILTGLYNRQCAEEKIASMMNQKFTLCFFDLDGLKQVNDRFGHEEGDRYLLAVSGHIQNACRTSVDALFRYGGDEFLAVFPEMPVSAARKRAETINELLKESNGAYPYPMSLSFGIAESAECSNWRDLIQTADRRMYEQKQKKRMVRG